LRLVQRPPPKFCFTVSGGKKFPARAVGISVLRRHMPPFLPIHMGDELFVKCFIHSAPRNRQQTRHWQHCDDAVLIGTRCPDLRTVDRRIAVAVPAENPIVTPIRRSETCTLRTTTDSQFRLSGISGLRTLKNYPFRTTRVIVQ